MTYLSETTAYFPAGRNISFSGTIALVIAAFVLASGAAAWMTDSELVASYSDPTFPKTTHSFSFDARFSPISAGEPFSKAYQPRPLIHFVHPELDAKFEEAKGRLAQEMRNSSLAAALVGEEPTQTLLAVIPLPRSRPVEANLLEPQSDTATAKPDNRTLLQKFSDLFPARITLASLAPDGGLLGDKPDLRSLGFDNLTAVYDISARSVYMPNGSKLEAHSGFGSFMDDPRHVSERNVGATPPNVYDLKPRERLFHGVPALRMIPVGDNGTLGRSGLLAHSYMLGPNGDSNGCVSIRNYERFLKAFQNGEIKRLVVVASLSDVASRRLISQL